MPGARRVLATGGRALAALAVAVLLATSSGCETDDSVGGLQPSCLTFISVKDPTPGEVTSVWGSESTCTFMEVELVVSGVSDIWSAQFEVHYPAGISDFAALDLSDSFLLEGATNLLRNVSQIDAGLVEIGITRDASENIAGVTPDPDGNTVLARLIFQRFTSSGEGDMTLEDATLSTVANPGDQPTEISVPFSGGEFFIEN